MSLIDRQDDFTEVIEDDRELVLPPLWEDHWFELATFYEKIPEDLWKVVALKKAFLTFQRRASYDWAYSRAAKRHREFLAIKERLTGIPGLHIPNIPLEVFDPAKETPFITKARGVINGLLETNPEIHGENEYYHMKHSKDSIKKIIGEYDIVSKIESYLVSQAAIRNRFYPSE